MGIYMLIKCTGVQETPIIIENNMIFFYVIYYDTIFIKQIQQMYQRQQNAPIPL